jgi:hypothetical protein
MDTPEGLAVVDYRLEGNIVTIYHTEVPLPLRGRGYGYQLVRDTLEEVRRLGLKVVRFVVSSIAAKVPLLISLPQSRAVSTPSLVMSGVKPFGRFDRSWQRMNAWAAAEPNATSFVRDELRLSIGPGNSPLIGAQSGPLSSMV